MHFVFKCSVIGAKRWITKNNRVVTIVSAFSGEEPLAQCIFTQGVAIKAPGDEFNQEIGERKALANAIAHFPREERLKIVEAYELNGNRNKRTMK